MSPLVGDSLSRSTEIKPEYRPTNPLTINMPLETDH